jgi:hypothetical protein
MGKNRIEAFSDGVIAIIITIMVLELKAPHGQSIKTLAPLIPVFLSYVLSFVYVGIYWNNHHHMLHTYCSGLACARSTHRESSCRQRIITNASKTARSRPCAGPKPPPQWWISFT